MEKQKAFTDIGTIAYYLHAQHKAITSPLKLELALYYLFAYYAGFYGQKDEEGVCEGFNDLPPRLFEATFRSTKFGPRNLEAAERFRSGEYKSNPEKQEQAVALIEASPEVRMFIDDLLHQIGGTSDFSLVDRAHEDEVWKAAYKQDGTDGILDNAAIAKEYSEKMFTLRR